LLEIINDISKSLKCADLVKNLKQLSDSLFDEEANGSNDVNMDDSQPEDEEENTKKKLPERSYSLRNQLRKNDDSCFSDDGDGATAAKRPKQHDWEEEFEEYLDAAWIGSDNLVHSIDRFFKVLYFSFLSQLNFITFI
jgi:hypothetical protein